MDRLSIADAIVNRLNEAKAPARQRFAASQYFVVDDLLPLGLASEIYEAFPTVEKLLLRKSIRELKYVTSQMDRCDKLLEECVYAFQDRRVVDLVGEITGLKEIEPDEKLYAGGISVMGEGHYLHPHLDNSHDMDRQRYRVLNLLYYTSPEWPEDKGGNFELWPNGFTEPLTIHSKFNRLLVIATNRKSWHSVRKVSTARLRTCISNYYFSPQSPEGEDYFHVTSFRGRPEQPVLDLALRGDAFLRGMIRKVFSRGLVKTKHFYAKP